VLLLVLNSDHEALLQKYSGSEFHQQGAAKEKDLWPQVTKLSDGTSSRFRVEDRTVLVGTCGLSKSLM